MALKIARAHTGKSGVIFFLSRKRLNFTAVGSGTVTGPQSIRINNNGGGTLEWNAETDSSWLRVSPPSGTGTGVLWISVNPDQPVGDYHGTLALRSSGT